MPIMELFGMSSFFVIHPRNTLPHPGFVTDTINRRWLNRLKKMELEDVFLQCGVGHDTGKRQRHMSLSARANRIVRKRDQRQVAVPMQQSTARTFPMKLLHGGQTYDLVLCGTVLCMGDPGVTRTPPSPLQLNQSDAELPIQQSKARAFPLKLLHGGQTYDLMLCGNVLCMGDPGVTRTPPPPLQLNHSDADTLPSVVSEAHLVPSLKRLETLKANIRTVHRHLI